MWLWTGSSWLFTLTYCKNPPLAYKLWQTPFVSQSNRTNRCHSYPNLTGQTSIIMLLFYINQPLLLYPIDLTSNAYICMKQALNKRSGIQCRVCSNSLPQKSAAPLCCFTSITSYSISSLCVIIVHQVGVFTGNWYCVMFINMYNRHGWGWHCHIAQREVYNS